MNKMVEEKQQHDFEKYPFGSWPRIVLAFRELTGIDLTDGQFDTEKEKRGDKKNEQ